MELSNVATNTQQNRVANKFPSGNLSAIFDRYAKSSKKIDHSYLNIVSLIIGEIE